MVVCTGLPWPFQRRTPPPTPITIGPSFGPADVTRAGNFSAPSNQDYCGCILQQLSTSSFPTNNDRSTPLPDFHPSTVHIPFHKYHPEISNIHEQRRTYVLYMRLSVIYEYYSNYIYEAFNLVLLIQSLKTCQSCGVIF